MRLVPQAGSLYWVDTTILPPGDPEAQRLVVVVDVPETVDGTVVVVVRSGVDDFGVGDGDGGGGGGGGRFSRRCPVQGRLWNSATVVPFGVLAEEQLAGVVARFMP